MLSSAGVVVGPHDEVLEATRAARTLGLARGSRVAIPELLDLVREVRRDGAAQRRDLQISRGSGAATTYLIVRVAPLGDGLIVILADDLTPRAGSRRPGATSSPTSATSSRPRSARSRCSPRRSRTRPTTRRRSAGSPSRMGIESARLADLVSQIIDLSRLQADDPAGRPEVGRHRRGARRCGRPVPGRRRAARGHAHPRRRAGRQVLGNARQLGVAVGNLVENAVVYSDPGARVVVAAHVAGAQRRRLRRDHGVRQRHRHPAGRASSASSSASTGSTTPAAGPTAAPGSACPSSSTSPPATAAGRRLEPARPRVDLHHHFPPTCGAAAAPRGGSESVRRGSATRSQRRGSDRQEVSR